jgi:hypothetical protein
MARERQAGYVTKQKDEGFGLGVNINRSPSPKMNLMPSGITKDGVIQPPFTGYREVIPPGKIGSVETQDPMEPAPQKVATVPYYGGPELRDVTLHDAVKAVQDGEEFPIEFQEYGTFEPRTAPMPRAAQDSVYLPGAGKNVADPRMTDWDSSEILQPHPGDQPDRLDLYGPNRDGMLHNEGHPGFKAVQSHIESEGYTHEQAGAILASKTRAASKAAHKANPRLSKVKG